jgi:galactitol-specific phosphotransferase system IIB component
MIKKSWTTLIAVSLFMLIFQLSVVSAESSGEVTQEESSSPQSQTNLADIFTAFSEVNTALEKEIKDYQNIIDDYTNDRATPNATNSNLLKLNESIIDTRSKAYSLKFTGKYEDDKIQLIRACDMLDQSLKDMKISVGLRNTSYYSRSKQELQDAIQFKAFVWKQIHKDLQDDGYIPSN